MAKSRKIPRNPTKEKHHNHSHEKPHSWAAVKSLLTCKYLQVQPHQQQEKQQQEQKQKQNQNQNHCKQESIRLKKQKLNLKLKHPSEETKSRKHVKKEQTLEETNKKCKQMKCSGSLCSNTKVMQRPEVSEEQKKKGLVMSLSSNSESDGSSRSMKTTTLGEMDGASGVSNTSSFSSASSSSFAMASSSPSIYGSFRNMPFRKLSGCYECRTVVDPVLGLTRDPSLRTTICSCPECAEIFMKPENLELHLAVRHAVSELGPEDTSKNIVEIIFQSSWLRKQVPVCKIDRILKVQNTPKTISKFEEYRDTIKSKATRLPKKHPRCIADGNELLRFHCTTLMCSLGLNGSSNLCNSIPRCNVCGIIKNGFKIVPEISSKGVLTTATSGKAHDSAIVGVDDGKRAMLVCRVIAGRVKKNPNTEGSSDEYDSVAGEAGVYSNLEELYVFNPKAILPCFVVIYRGV